MPSQSSCANVIAVHRQGVSFKVLADRHKDFWISFSTGMWEDITFRVFDAYLSPGDVYYDIGAWIGPTLLYCAQKADVCYAFEPDPVAYAELKANLAMNVEAVWSARIQIFQQAVARQSGSLQIGSKGEAGDSMTSEWFAHGKQQWTVPAVSLQEFVYTHPAGDKPVFMKLDIEGGEFALIPHFRSLLQSLRPQLLVSLHPAFLKEMLRVRYGPGIIGRLLARVCFAVAYGRLLSALPGRGVYSMDGELLCVRKEVMRALRFGGMEYEVLATDQEWRL